MNVLSIELTKGAEKRELPFWLIKLIRFEFWPSWVLYMPVFIYYLWLSLKARSFTFFTAANPGIYLGGFAGESKSEILAKINQHYLPETLYFKKEDQPEKVLEKLNRSGISYPLIIKPDVGERGKGVEKITSEEMLLSYIQNSESDLIIQEFIPYDLELGILYYRTPDGKKSGITSVVVKDFLSITGDGSCTVRQLIEQSLRARLRKEYLLDKFSKDLNYILAKDDQLLLEPIGNHCRGTRFINGNSLITPRLVEVFDLISKEVDGFYIGRYDLKVRNLDDLYAGKNIRIMELNGVTSEPGHIYDPSSGLFEAYSALFNQYDLLYKIAVQNHRKGVKYASFSTVYTQVIKHFKNAQ